MRSATVCAEPGCPNIATARGRCPDHQLPGRHNPRRADGRTTARLRRRVAARDGWVCRVCGHTGPLELHHLNGDAGDDRLANLELRCPPHNPRGAAHQRLVAQQQR